MSNNQKDGGKKYRNIREYLKGEGLKRDELRDYLLRSSLLLLAEAGVNFGGDGKQTARAAFPLICLNEILDEVE